MKLSIIYPITLALVATSASAYAECVVTGRLASTKSQGITCQSIEDASLTSALRKIGRAGALLEAIAYPSARFSSPRGEHQESPDVIIIVRVRE